MLKERDYGNAGEALIQAVVSTVGQPFTLVHPALVRLSEAYQWPLGCSYRMDTSCPHNPFFSRTVLPEALSRLPVQVFMFLAVTCHPLWAPLPFPTSQYWGGLHPGLPSQHFLMALNVGYTIIIISEVFFIFSLNLFPLLNSNIHYLDVT